MIIKKEVIRKIFEHALKDSPSEACGYLAEKNGVFIRHYELKNKEKLNNRFSFFPEEQLKTILSARKDGINVGAIYHSHPKTVAWPSKKDIENSKVEGINYVIVSMSGNKQEVIAYKIIDNALVFEEVIQA